MPELPDITVYCEALERRLVGRMLERIRLTDVFVLRTAVPPIASLEQRRVTAVRRIAKRIALRFEPNPAGSNQHTPPFAPPSPEGTSTLHAGKSPRDSVVAERGDGPWLVIHLMIAGRLQWSDAGGKMVTRNALATLFFENGALVLTEAGTKRRASLHVAVDEGALKAHDPGGIDVLASTTNEFAAALTRENHTLKRVLTDPHVFSGIGNAYSDEILHAAKLSPLALSQRLNGEEIARLHSATKDVLRRWTDRLREEAGDGFPINVTAFRPEMTVHGKFGQPCPVCGTKVQRIVYAENEVNYCPGCQTGGKLLADRSLSRLLKDDWGKGFKVEG